MNKKSVPKISYDHESRVLEIQLKPGKSVDSDIQGNVVIDYDKDGIVIRINLYQFDFSRFQQTKRAVRMLTKQHMK